MAAQPELRRQKFAQIVQTAGHVKNARAFLALEMVVVALAGSFVPGRLSGNLDCFDLAGIQERANGSIDRRDPQSRNFS